MVRDFYNSFLFSACWIYLFLSISNANSWLRRMLFSEMRFSRFAEYSAAFCWLSATRCWFYFSFSLSSWRVTSSSPITFLSYSPRFLRRNSVSSTVVDRHFFLISSSSCLLLDSITEILLAKLPSCSRRAWFYRPYSSRTSRTYLYWPSSCLSFSSFSAAERASRERKLCRRSSLSFFSLAVSV
jgi:hypothetical protein